MAFGVTTEGFVRKDLATVKSDIEARQRAEISDGLNQQDDSLLGQLNGVVINGLSELWEVLEAVYNSQFPDTADGAALDNVSALTGTTRNGQTFSTVVCTVNIDGGFTLPAGTVCFDPDRPDVSRFVLDEDVENTGGSADDFTASFTAESPGPVVANAGTLTGGPELVTGWNSCTNPEDAEVGRDVETDAALRLRRLQELAGPGSATPDAIRADISKLEGVSSVSVINNPSDETVDGVPPHAFEVVVLGGDDTEIAESIFENRASGILPFGSTTVLVTDSEGQQVSIGFTRPSTVDIHLEIDLSVDADYPVDGDDLVKTALVDFGAANFGQGDDVIASLLKSAAFNVAGVRDVTALRLGFAASPTGTINLIILKRQLADFDTSRVVVSTAPFVDV